MEGTEGGINQQRETMQADNSTKTLEEAETNHADIEGSSSLFTSEDRLLNENHETSKEVVMKQESSSIPTWGQSKGATKEQLEEDWQVWEHANIHETSIVYRHGRCHDCDKPVSSTVLDPDHMLLCWECKPNIIEEDTKENTSDKRGFGKAERDDEEEWKRIPIPTSDDSSEGDWASEEFYLEESPPSEGVNEEDIAAPVIVEEPTAETNKHVRNNYMSIVKKDNDKCESTTLAFLIGPRRDGVILKKDGTLISTYDIHNNKDKDPLQPMGQHTTMLSFHLLVEDVRVLHRILVK
jgi:hypothetical protein